MFSQSAFRSFLIQRRKVFSRLSHHFHNLVEAYTVLSVRESRECICIRALAAAKAFLSIHGI